MLKEDVLAEVMKYHDPKLVEVDPGHVSEVWEDGEHTSTKCGSLFRQRTLHCLKPGYQRKPEVIAYFKANLPNKVAGHANAYIPWDHADRIAKLIDEAE